MPLSRRQPKPSAKKIVLSRPLKPDEILGQIGDWEHLAQWEPPQVGENSRRLLPGTAYPGKRNNSNPK